MPDWSGLRQFAWGQAGLFRLEDAVVFGFYAQSLAKHVVNGKLTRLQHGIYRLSCCPPMENEQLVEAWLWSRRVGVISHETALQLHNLSDALPGKIHLTLPKSGSRRLVTPPLYRVWFNDIPPKDRVWIGSVPTTNPARTVNDIAASFGSGDIVKQAIEEGVHRRLFSVFDVIPAIIYVGSIIVPAPLGEG